MKKTPVLEPVYWLVWRNNSHICEKEGTYLISFSYFCSLLYDTQHLISGPPSHRDIFPSLVVRARRGRVQVPRDVHFSLPTARLTGGEGLNWTKGFRGKILSHVSLCITEEGCDLRLRASLVVQVMEQATWL